MLETRSLEKKNFHTPSPYLPSVSLCLPRTGVLGTRTHRCGESLNTIRPHQCPPLLPASRLRCTMLRLPHLSHARKIYCSCPTTNDLWPPTSFAPLHNDGDRLSVTLPRRWGTVLPTTRPGGRNSSVRPVTCGDMNLNVVYSSQWPNAGCTHDPLITQMTVCRVSKLLRTHMNPPHPLIPRQSDLIGPPTANPESAKRSQRMTVPFHQPATSNGCVSLPASYQLRIDNCRPSRSD